MTFRATVLLVALLIASAEGVQPRPQRLTLRTEDGFNIAATWYEPAYRPAPAVILVPMLGRTRREWDSLASRLASEGIGALAIDLRGQGDSAGYGSRDFPAMLHDVKAARRHLAIRADVLQMRLGIAGASLGANLAALAAAEDPGIVSLALLSPSLDYRGLRIEAALRKYGSRAALLVAGTDDGYAMRSAKELQKFRGGIRELLLLDAAGHGMNMLGRAPDLPRQLVEWFRRTLQ